MNCTKCGKTYETEDRFCRSCGTQIFTSTPNNSSISGDQSFNAGQNNIITGNTISLGVVNQEPAAYIDRIKTTPITLAGHPVKTAWVIISGTLGLIGSLAGIFGTWGSYSQYIWLMLLGLSSAAFLLGITLNRVRFARLHHCLTLSQTRQMKYS